MFLKGGVSGQHEENDKQPRTDRKFQNECACNRGGAEGGRVDGREEPPLPINIYKVHS